MCILGIRFAISVVLGTKTCDTCYFKAKTNCSTSMSIAFRLTDCET